MKVNNTEENNELEQRIFHHAEVIGNLMLEYKLDFDFIKRSIDNIESAREELSYTLQYPDKAKKCSNCLGRIFPCIFCMKEEKDITGHYF